MTKRSVLIVSACILLIVVIGLVFFHGNSRLFDMSIISSRTFSTERQRR
ncbi:MAG: hypothetical protein NT018_09985 [Armatimonadetes bacterium]|nr:hypothetical protein [Armatimonadota bacterium]